LLARPSILNGSCHYQLNIHKVLAADPAINVICIWALRGASLTEGFLSRRTVLGTPLWIYNRYRDIYQRPEPAAVRLDILWPPDRR